MWTKFILDNSSKSYKITCGESEWTNHRWAFVFKEITFN